jgi:hypothetical protein
MEPASLPPHALDGGLLTRSIHAKTFEKRSKSSSPEKDIVPEFLVGRTTGFDFGCRSI